MKIIRSSKIRKEGGRSSLFKPQKDQIMDMAADAITDKIKSFLKEDVLEHDKFLSSKQGDQTLDYMIGLFFMYVAPTLGGKSADMADDIGKRIAIKATEKMFFNK